MKTSIFITFCISLFCSIGIQAQQNQNGLIAHYLFNGDAKDESGNSNHGTAYGGTNYDMDRFGSSCGALHFDGIDGYVSVPDSRSLRSPYQELSISVWFKLDQGAGAIKWMTVLCKSDSSEELPESPQYRFQTTNQTVSISTEFTENFVKDVAYGQWHHYALTYNGQEISTFLDGQIFFSFPYNGVFIENKMPLEIGRDMPGALEYFSGSFDDLRIFNRGLSAQEITTIYQDQSEENSSKPCDVAAVPSTPPTALTIATPPTIHITTPSNSPHNSQQDLATIQATIEHIQSAKDIYVEVNGQETQQFSFDEQTGQFSSSINLVKGYNICLVKVNNQDGNDEATVLINYTPNTPDKQLPVIRLLQPMDNPHQAPHSTQNIQASIKHVASDSDIQLKINSQLSTEFNYDQQSELLTSTISLEEGYNLIEITATNLDGSITTTNQIKYVPTRTSLPLTDKKPSFEMGSIKIKKDIVLPIQQVELLCFDHKKEDGDMVSIIINDVVIADKIVLKSKGTGAFKYRLQLTPNEEYILVSKAWNLGKTPPNTMTIDIMDGKQRLERIELESNIGESEAVRFIYQPSSGN